MPVILSTDIREAYVRLRVSPASTHLSLFLIDYYYKNQQLNATATEHNRLVTIQALFLIMGLSQSPAYMSLCPQDLTKDIPHQHLWYFLQYLHYLDDLQLGVTAEEITELQDPDLNRQCPVYDCCPYEADLSPPPEDVLGEVVTQDEQRCTHHLIRNTCFGQQLFHKLKLRASTLEAALVKADMPTKGATTSLQQLFQHEFVNEAIAVYTKILLEGGNQEVYLLASVPLLPHFQVWEPDKNGFPRWWHKTGPDQTSTAPQVNQQEEEPILRMAASAEHPTDTAKLTC